jgi:hypothetical protein
MGKVLLSSYLMSHRPNLKMASLQELQWQWFARPFHNFIADVRFDLVVKNEEDQSNWGSVCEHVECEHACMFYDYRSSETF